MRVYISGKIGEEVISDATREKFARAEKMLQERLSDFSTVVNPASEEFQVTMDMYFRWWQITKNLPDILLYDLKFLKTCDVIYMLDDWDQSDVANLELDYARCTGKKIWWQDEEDAKVFCDDTERYEKVWVPIEKAMKETYKIELKKQGEQNTVVVIPKFRVGDVIRPKGSMAEYTIESISGECYHGKGWGLHISCDDDYELVEQKPTAWSEEDETVLSNLVYALANDRIGNNRDEYVAWLKTLRHRSPWKPSKEQIIALRWVLNNVPYCTHKEEISGLLDQIKEL